MPNPISSLPGASTLTGAEYLPADQGAGTVRVPLSDLFEQGGQETLTNITLDGTGRIVYGDEAGNDTTLDLGTTFLKKLDSIAQLKAVDTSVLPDGYSVYLSGTSGASDGNSLSYYWDTDFVGDDDGDLVIAPTVDDGTGRWRKVRTNIPELNRRAFAGGRYFDGVSGLANSPDFIPFPAGGEPFDFAISLVGMVPESENDCALLAFGSPVGASTGYGGLVIGYQKTSGGGTLSFNNGIGVRWQQGGSTPTEGIATTPGTFQRGKVFHLLFSYKVGVGTSLYLNGNLVATGSAPTVFPSRNSGMLLGVTKTYQYALYSECSVRDVGFLNFVPTDAQVVEIAEEGIQAWVGKHPEYELGKSESDDLEDGKFLYNVSLAGTQIVTYGSTPAHSVYDLTVNPDAIGTNGSTKCAKMDTVNHVGGQGWGFSAGKANDPRFYIISFDYYVPAGQPDLNVQVTTTMAQAPLSVIPNDLTVKDTWQRVSYLFRTGAENLGRFLCRSANTTTGIIAYFDNFTIQSLGPLCINPLDDIGYQLRDVTGNGNHAIASATGTYSPINKIGEYNLEDYVELSTASQRDVLSLSTQITLDQTRFKAVIFESTVADWVELWADPVDGTADVQITSRYSLEADVPADLPLLNTLPRLTSELSLYWKFGTTTAKTYSATIEMSKIK